MTTGDHQDHAAQLRELRRRLTLEQIARRLDVSYSTVQRWTQDRSRPTSRMQQRIADLYQAERLDNAAPTSAPEDTTRAEAAPEPSSGAPRDFIGRARELAELQEAWAGCQILTLTGPGGIGKSRLAAELQRRSSRILLAAADFGTVSDPDLAVSALARTLGARPRPGIDERDALAEVLREQEGVLLLDTCEHVTDQLRLLLDDVLPAAPKVTVLATSLRPLGVRGETIWRVPGLELSARVAGPVAAGPGEQPVLPDAVRFFLAKAHEHARSFGPDGVVPAGVTEICRQLDGIPLALGLAAAQVAVFSPATMLRHWEALLAMVQNPSAEQARQRSLTAAIEWSAAFLPEGDQELARQMAVLVGSVTTEDIAAIVPDRTLADVLASIRRLCELSWLEFSPAAEAGLYRMLDPLRAWGLAGLAGSGRAAAARQRHARYIADLCGDAETDHFRSDSVDWPVRLEQAAGNIQAALTWCVTEDRRLAGELATRLLNWWRLSGRLADGDHWYRRLATSATPEPQRARVTCAEALIAVDIGDYDRAGHQAALALEALLRQGDELWAGRALTALSSVAKYRDRSEDALGYLQRALAHQQRHGDQHEIAVALNNLGSLAHDLGSLAEAEGYYRLSLDAKRHAGNRRSLAHTMANLGDVLTQSGRHREGRQMLDDALHIVTGIPDDFLAAFVSINLGENLIRTSDPAGAQSAFERALSYADQHKIARFQALAACGLGRALCDQGVYAQGVPLLQESARTARLIGDEMLIGQAQAALDALPPDALRPGGLLSPRQAEVLRMAAGDLTIAQIARRLSITESTVEKHLDRIYKALDVHNRTAAIMRAQELRILPPA